MKTLILLRHAKSSRKDTTLADADRPLNKRGRRDAPFMGRLLDLKAVQVDAIISSPAVRALETARAVAEELKIPSEQLMTNSRIYEASRAMLLQLIAQFDDRFTTILLVGHNPGFTDLVNALINSDNTIDNIPTSGAACLDFPVGVWKDVRPGSGALRFFEYPKKYMMG